MNETVNKFLLVSDKFMSEMHLEQPGFTYSACGPFNKNKERIEKFMQTGNTDKALKVLKDKAFKIASDPKYDGFQRGLASMVFDKKSKGSGIVTNKPNYQLANELHKPIIRKFEKERFIHHLEIIFGVLI